VNVKPIDRKEARRICELHPHAGSLPNSSKYYFAAYINGKVAGLAVWGWGIVPRKTPKALFGDAGKFEDYLELCRFFVFDWTPKYTASKFLSFTHRLLKRHTKLKYLYTYAAGFQGLIGTIYQAANYDYIGRKLCRLFYVPKNGLVHPIPLYHRYKINTHFAKGDSLVRLQKIFPEMKIWCGYNFVYIYWLRDKEKLMKHAKFDICNKYPTKEDLKIWLEDEHGNKEPISVEFAKTVPLIKLKSNRNCDVGVKRSTASFQDVGGGAIPTTSLHLSHA